MALTEIPAETSGVAAAAARFPTATLHEAAGRVGDLPPEIKPVGPLFRVAGPAYPVRSPAGSNLHLHHAIRRAAPGDVLVVDVGSGYDWGYWGEILSEAARAADLGGLVIDGCVRDRAELLSVGFPVFARGLCIRGTEKLTGGGTLGEEIQVGRVTVKAGDIVVGDVDGVVVLDREAAPEIVAAAADRERKEQDIITAIKSGTSTIDLYGFPPVEEA
ncbi:RraA family protein [Pseudonocardia xishanensis]|uniref:Putative 4-hydroxy-4-methyl-2-oxoglutarate aldolase n=1 Tax=Pseudonocardia xishanensis TaxID=630995 RepID=A0ABP8RV61_9PSEU